MMPRGTGETARQLKDAPQGATFVWCTDDLAYPKRLARALKREDIHIVGVSWVREERWRGVKFPSRVILDHATRLTEREFHLFFTIRQESAWAELPKTE